MIKRNRADESEVANMLDKIRRYHEIVCRHNVCEECPLGRLNDVFEVTTCENIEKLIKRLEVIYKVVETL